MVTAKQARANLDFPSPSLLYEQMVFSRAVGDPAFVPRCLWRLWPLKFHNPYCVAVITVA